MVYPDGREYIGQWFDDFPHGEGIFKFENK